MGCLLPARTTAWPRFRIEGIGSDWSATMSKATAHRSAAPTTTPAPRVARRRNFTDSEFAGACYSPDGQWLFANIQSPGITVAITGPWRRGAL
jgi:secreted PhoX family phosphatase